MRSLKFSERDQNRYWWSKLRRSNFIPSIYQFLDRKEWKILERWYKETEKRRFIGECNVPIMSVLQGFIQGSIIEKILQLGTYAGYSTILIGFMLKKMNVEKGLFTIDIDKTTSDFAQKYVKLAKLKKYVKINIGNSTETKFIEESEKYLSGKPQLIIIDSSHQYEQTLDELNLWIDALVPGGFIFLHDSSDFARDFDATKKRGVKRALDEWILNKKNIGYINISSDKNTPIESLVYKDGCGLAIIQKKDF